MASEGGRSKLKRDTSVKDRILFFEEILEEDSVSSCSTEKKVGKTLPRKIRTPRGHTEASTTASDETQSTGHVSGERSVCGTVRKERSREHFNASKRRFAVQEILTSERTYVNMLDMLVMHFKTPLMRLSKDKKFLDETTINSLFSNIDSILLFNKNLYMSISDRLNGWEKEGDSTHQVIGDIFINAAPALPVYFEYISNYANAVGTLEKLKKEKPEFSSWMAEKGQKVGYDFLNLFVIPVQRIPRYRLLIDAVVTCTDKLHPDYNLLTQALSAIQTQAETLNEFLRHHDNQKRLVVIGAMIVGDSNIEGGGLVQPHRKLISEHNLILMDWEDASESFTNEDEINERSASCFIFNDIFLVTLPRPGGTLEYVGHMAHHEVFLKLPFKSGAPPFSFQAVNPAHCFQFRAASEETLYQFKTSLQDARNAMMDADPANVAYRKRIKLEKNDWTGEWEATVIPPKYSPRVTTEQMEKVSIFETKKALEELLNQNRVVLETKKVQTVGKRKRLDGIKDMVSKFSPLKKRPVSHQFTEPTPIKKIEDLDSLVEYEEVTQAEQLNLEIRRLAELEEKIKHATFDITTEKQLEVVEDVASETTPRGRSHHAKYTNHGDKVAAIASEGTLHVDRQVCRSKSPSRRSEKDDMHASHHVRDTRSKSPSRAKILDAITRAATSSNTHSHTNIEEREEKEKKEDKDEKKKENKEKKEKGRSRSPTRGKQIEKEERKDPAASGVLSTPTGTHTPAPASSPHYPDSPMRATRERLHQQIQERGKKPTRELRRMSTRTDQQKLKRAREETPEANDTCLTGASNPVVEPMAIQSGSGSVRKKMRIDTPQPTDGESTPKSLDEMFVEKQEKENKLNQSPKTTPNRRKTLTSPVSRRTMKKASTLGLSTKYLENF